jgi:heme oxygenase (biliverdin-IX-beta and delta-forming)
MPLTLEKQPAQVVKSETGEQHRQVEELLLPKLRSIASVQDYAVILQMFYGYYMPLENLIRGFITPADIPDIAKRRTAGLILQDLKAMGILIPALPLCNALPRINNAPMALGAMYVLEGSTLGGKMIARMLAKNSAVPANALNFFYGYGEETGPMWTSFIQELNKQEDTSAIVFAANETFHHSKSWMQSIFTT